MPNSNPDPDYIWVGGDDDELDANPGLVELAELAQDEDEDEDEEEEGEEEEGEEEEEEEEEEEDEREDDFVPPVIMERVSQNLSSNSVQSAGLQGAEEVNVSTQVPQNAIEVVNVEDDYRRREQREASSSSARRVETEEIDGVEQPYWNDLDGASCPICMEPWSTEGDHQLCCLPCGHLYGKSCIERWIQQSGRNNAKCPQCKRKYTSSAIRVLYASRVVAVDGSVQKEVVCLKEHVRSLKSRIESAESRIEHAEKRMTFILEEIKSLKKKGTFLGTPSLRQVHTRPSELIAVPVGSQGQILSGHSIGVGSQGYSCCSFEFKDELLVDSAKIFDMDSSSPLLLLARRLPGMGGMHVLTKISMTHPDEREDIHLPQNTKAVRDLHISPSSSKLALLASLGKKLSILSMERNNFVLTYDLPAPAWSCSWDLNSSHHIYAGLQNGMILVFDMRHTTGPIESCSGPSSHPVHTIYSLVHDSAVPYGGRTLLSASSVGPCIWNMGVVGQRPSLIPGMENQGVCISLAYSPTSDDIMATFRPKVQTSNDTFGSQPSISPSFSVVGQGVQGSHVHVKRMGSSCYQTLGSTYTYVNDVRLPKSMIINLENCNPLFAYGDEATRSMKVWDLSSLRVIQSLEEQHQHPILDVKYTCWGTGLLGYLCEDKLELFSARLS